jgi:hypothetical protein
MLLPTLVMTPLLTAVTELPSSPPQPAKERVTIAITAMKNRFVVRIWYLLFDVEFAYLEGFPMPRSHPHPLPSCQVDSGTLLAPKVREENMA